jgi:hypothetical protein
MPLQVASRIESLARVTRPVTQEWTHGLTLMQQSVLLSAIRGCDGLPKRHKSKALVKWYRRCVLLSAFDGRALPTPYDEGGGSFAGPIVKIPTGTSDTVRDQIAEQVLSEVANDFIDSRDELPAHYQVHMMHAIEILGFKHPVNAIRQYWHRLYVRMVEAYHLWPETEAQLDARLGDNLEGWMARSDPSATCSD